MTQLTARPGTKNSARPSGEPEPSSASLAVRAVRPITAYALAHIAVPIAA